MIKEPPPFQEAATCDVCGCNFSAFRRRHHCRCCGRTLCHEHSSNQMALPQFGIYSYVRVCGDCFNDFSSHSSRKERMQPSSDGIDSVTNDITKLDIGGGLDSNVKPTAENPPALGISSCKCGMPLCICAAPSPSTKPLPTLSKDTSFTPKFNPKPVKTYTDKAKNKASTSNINFGKVSTLDGTRTDYELNGEGLREAVKNGDTSAVKKLLSEGVDANYRDKQGFSLLHLAAVFNHTDIVFALIESGASLEYKNPQGETPIDCAPVTLQHKIRVKMEECNH